MKIHQLSRWQKAAAVVPVALLVSAWGATLVNTDLANAEGGTSDVSVPEVPTSAFDQPATVQAASPGIDEKAGAAGTLATLSSSGIPASALSAYRRAETLLDKADPSCNLSWTLVAAIGRVESNHGRSNGNALNKDGQATPGIFGIPLTGRNGTTKITDTDNGRFDDDGVWDRAVGPLQFIPGTWQAVAVDADGDDAKNPQDIDDAATSAGVYLCAGTDDLSTRPGASAAVKRYNHSDSYVDLVLRIAERYEEGDFSTAPDGVTSGPTLTSRSFDQTLTPKERRDARRAELGKGPKEGKGGKGSGSGSGGSNGSGGTPSEGAAPGSPSTGSPLPGTSPSKPSSGGGLSDLVKGVTEPVVGNGSTKDGDKDDAGSTPTEVIGEVVDNTLTWTQAKLKCILSGVSEVNLKALTKCITDLLG